MQDLAQGDRLTSYIYEGNFGRPGLIKLFLYLSISNGQEKPSSVSGQFKDGQIFQKSLIAKYMLPKLTMMRGPGGKSYKSN